MIINQVVQYKQKGIEILLSNSQIVYEEWERGENRSEKILYSLLLVK